MVVKIYFIFNIIAASNILVLMFQKEREKEKKRKRERKENTSIL